MTDDFNGTNIELGCDFIQWSFLLDNYRPCQLLSFSFLYHLLIPIVLICCCCLSSLHMHLATDVFKKETKKNLKQLPTWRWCPLQTEPVPTCFYHNCSLPIMSHTLSGRVHFYNWGKMKPSNLMLSLIFCTSVSMLIIQFCFLLYWHVNI